MSLSNIKTSKENLRKMHNNLISKYLNFGFGSKIDISRNFNLLAEFSTDTDIKVEYFLFNLSPIILFISKILVIKGYY